MRIATFNLESLDWEPGRHAPPEERMAVLRPQLLRLEADILCLQEINGQHRSGAEQRSLEALDVLLSGTPYASFHRRSTTGPHGKGVADVHNLVTLSRWPIAEHREIRNTVLPSMDYAPQSACPPVSAPIKLAFDRALLLTTISLGSDKHLSVLNLHLRAPLALPIAGQKEAPFTWRSVSGWAEGYFLSSLKRSAQALEARMLVDQLMDSDPERFIVLAGDFNAEDHETPLKILIGSEEDTGNGRLAPRSLAVLDRSLAEDRRFSVLHHGRPVMLDHVLASRALLSHFRTIEAHNETLGDELVAYGRTKRSASSYHAPVVAEFSLP